MPLRRLWFAGKKENPVQFARWIRTTEAFLGKAARGAFK